MFVSRLKEIRIKRKLTQRVLAELSNLSQVTVHNIEHNKKHTKFATIEKIARALNVNPYSLFEYICPEYEKCTNPEKKQSDCYAKGKCEIYNNSMHLLYFIVFCCCLYDIAPFI